ncbi:hypothetical protein KP79_PYT05684 [Mizuhopecten yessoensis]|uniref:COX assembly mitochondrial protein n=1 Tax=Mizuhopecten yessoensis TaxID=6573 RepID=A0A210QFS7_MIZYE|nr:hypothetical protein KP79_PYT05684 [Mizuhopecten yessoensis]
MPRLTEFVLAKHKRAFGYKPDPQRYKVWNAPFIVKNSLKMKTDRILSERPCTDELKTMLDCYKIHDFKYKGLCDVQIQSFNNCLAQHQVGEPQFTWIWMLQV